MSICVALMALATAAGAANLVVNPDFDTDASGWTSFGATISFDATMNQVGAPGSGAGLVTNPDPGFNQGVVQCIASGLSGGTSYDLGSWVYFASGQAGTGNAGIFATFFDQANCTGTQISSLFVNPYLPPPSDTWTLLTVTGVAPAGSVSAWVYINVYNSGNSGSISAEYDGVRFGPTPTTPVELQDFGVD
jgi:hypothetical protein